MSVSFRRLGAVSTLALATAMQLPAPAAAQESIFTALGRIIVSAGRARVAIDTPQAVTALESEDLEREQAATPGELLRAAPGVQAWGSAALTGQLLNIRGIGTFSQSDENRIIVTIDGVQKYNEQYNMGSQFGEPDLYRRVEVLRGPAASMLHGSGALGGVVAFETREASDFLTTGNTALRFRASAASNGEAWSGTGIVAHRFNERFELLGALTTRHEGPIEPGDGGPAITATDMAAQSALISGTWRLGDNSEQRLRFTFSRWQTDGRQVPYSTTRNLGVFGFIDRKVTDDTAQITWENPASDTPWLDARVQLSYSNTATEQRNATAPIPSELFDDADYAYETWRLDARNTIEARGDNWENYLTFGGTLTHLNRVATNLSGSGRLLTFHAAGHSNTAALYLQNEFILNRDLSVLAALRYDRATSTATGNIDPSAIGIPATRDGFSGSLAAHYQINDAWAVFGSVARTTRLPSIDELFSYQAPRFSSYTTLRPERARSYELGFSWQGRSVLQRGDGLDLKLTAFHNSITDRIATAPSGPNPNYVNIAQSRIRGVELEAGYESDRWFGRVAASHIEGIDVLSGDVLTSTPASELMLEVGHRFPARNLELGWRGTFTQSIDYPTVSVPGAAIHDLFLTWRPDNHVMRDLTVQFAINNVTDELYYNALDVGANGFAGAWPQRGRDFRLTVGRTIEF